MVHHQYPVAELLHQRNVVGDKENGEAAPLLGSQGVQQLQNFLLHRHIQRGGDLVADQKPGRDGQRPGDRRPLALSAADLMRVAAGIFRGQAAVFQEGFYSFPGFLLGKPGISQAFADTVA